MSKVINLFEKKSDRLTPEQRLKMFCISQLVDENTAATILSHMSVDDAFRFLADKAVEWNLIDNK